jgi:hypothetical protein
MVEPAAAATGGLDQGPGGLLPGRRPAITGCGRTCAHLPRRGLRAGPIRVVPTGDLAVLRSATLQAGRLTRDQSRLFSSAPAKRQSSMEASVLASVATGG